MDILVVGGGIAGLSAAIGLRRAQPDAVSVDVAEIANQPAGAAITMLNQSLTALRELGVYSELSAVGTQLNAAALPLYDASGKPQSFTFGGDSRTADANSQEAASENAEPMGLALYRPELAEVLARAAAQQGANKLPTGLTADALDNGPEGVEVTFTDGSRRHYDLVVGADGIRSFVRQEVFGDAYQPRFVGDMMLRCMVDGQGVELPSGFHIGEHGALVVAHMRNGLTYVASGFTSEQVEVYDTEQARARLRMLLRGFTNPQVHALGERVSAVADISCRALESVWIDEPWYRDRVVVIGDAAHAATPHLASGGGLALEDGVVLASELTGGGTVDEGLARFYRRRCERAGHVVRTSLRLSELAMVGESEVEAGRLRAEAFARLAKPY